MANVIKDLSADVDHSKFQQKLDDYKVQLGKYHGMMLQDLKAGAGQEKTAAFTEALISEHKNRLIHFKDEGLSAHAD